MISFIIIRTDTEAYFEGFCVNGNPKWVKKLENAKVYPSDKGAHAVRDSEILLKKGFKIKLDTKK